MVNPVRKKRAGLCLLLSLLFFLASSDIASGQFWLKRKDACENIQNLALKDISDKQVSLKEYIGSSPLLLLFWTSWCPYCRQTIKELNALYKDLDEPQLKFILINVGETKARVEKFLSQFKNHPFIVLLDHKGEVSWDCNVRGIPTFIIIDKNGEVDFIGNYLPEKYLSQN